MADDRSDDGNGEPPVADESGAGSDTTDEGEPAASDPLTDVETDTRTRTVPDEEAADPDEEGDGGSSTGAEADGTGGDATAEAGDGDDSRSEKAADEVYCSSCGELIKREAEVCPHCGVRQAGPTGSSEKEPVLAALLSFIIPGAGQVYNGQVGRGALAFFGALVVDFLITVLAIVLTVIVIGPLLFLLIPVVHALIMYDAYHQAELINQGEVVP